MSKHTYSLIARVTVAISKQAHMSPGELGYEQATNDAADILGHLGTYIDALEACVNQTHLATIEAQVSASHPIKTLDQLLED